MGFLSYRLYLLQGEVTHLLQLFAELPCEGKEPEIGVRDRAYNLYVNVEGVLENGLELFLEFEDNPKVG